MPGNGPAYCQALHAKGHKIRCIQSITGLYRLTVTRYLYVPKKVRKYKAWNERTLPDQEAATERAEAAQHLCTCHIMPTPAPQFSQSDAYPGAHLVSGWPWYHRVVRTDGTVMVVGTNWDYNQ